MRRLILACVLACLVASHALGQSATTGTTFRYAGGPITAFAASPTDWVVVTGSGTKTIIVNKLSVCGSATSAATLDIVLLKHSTANTGGTSTPDTAVNLSANNVTPTSTVVVYTANPTLGTGNAQLDVKKLNLGPPTGNAGCVLLEYGANGAAPIAIKGAAQQLAINLNGITMPTGVSLDYMIELTEQ